MSLSRAGMLSLHRSYRCSARTPILQPFRAVLDTLQAGLPGGCSTWSASKVMVSRRSFQAGAARAVQMVSPNRALSFSSAAARSRVPTESAESSSSAGALAAAADAEAPAPPALNHLRHGSD